MVQRLLCIAVCASAIVAGSAFSAGADAASPDVTSAPGAALVAGHTEFDLATVGYEQSEYLVEGTANAYAPDGVLTSDGRWSVGPSSQAPYRTRIVVNRPRDARDFSGTVFVEWLNVSGGVDASPDWMQSHVELIRRGDAWVGVTAQTVGVESLKAPPAQLEFDDTARYASLDHPGDSYSYDIFSQAGQAVRDRADVVLDGWEPERVIAVGESQSASRLVTYVNAVHPLAEVYDGFLIHSRGSSGSALSQDPLPAVEMPSPSLVRGDLDVPVLEFQLENDVGGLQARQDDAKRYRRWEVAGTSHYDQYGLSIGATDTGDLASYVDWFETMRNPTNQPHPAFSCDLPINVGPATFVLRAAISALDEWVADGSPPPKAPRLRTVSLEPFEYALDSTGIVRGGIRTPAVDAPVAVLGGIGNRGEGPIGRFCGLFGNTVPLTVGELTERYESQRGFAAAWKRATEDAVKAGFILPDDAEMLRAVPGETAVIP